MQKIILNDNDVFDGLDDGERGGIFQKTKFKKLFIVKGNNCVIRNIHVSHPKKDFDRIISIEGKNCLIEGCVFSYIDMKGPIIVLERKKWNKIPDELIIKDCLFINGQDQKENGNECIRLGHSESSLKGAGRCIIINNRFENMQREIETISVKSHHNILVNNTFLNSTTLTLRHGTGSIVAFNTFDNKGNNLGGVRVVDSNHTIDNNLFMNIEGKSRLRTAISIMCGVEDPPLNRYTQAKNTNIRENTFVNCGKVITLGVEKEEANLKPRVVIIEGNSFVKCKEIINKDEPINFLNSDIAYTMNKEDETEYEVEVKEFKVKPFVEFALELLNYQKEEPSETPSELTEPESPPMPDITIKDFVDKLTKKLKLLELENRIKKISEQMKRNTDEFARCMRELKDFNK